MQPLIGITCSRLTGGAWSACSLGHFMDYTFADYGQALLNAGAAPVIIPSAQDAESLSTILNALQGLVLSGGPDVHPRRYGQEPAVGLGQVDEVLDQMELAIARMAIARDLPVLAVCRGIQVLNVALGGTLYQDILLQVPHCICHTPKADKGVNTHTVKLVEGSLLHQLLKTDTLWVNSQHHQAVKEPAPSLEVNAVASDGIIEAVVYPAGRFVLGLQWHPEGNWRTDTFSQQILAAFVAAAGRGGYQTKKTPALGTEAGDFCG